MSLPDGEAANRFPPNLELMGEIGATDNFGSFTPEFLFDKIPKAVEGI